MDVLKGDRIEHPVQRDWMSECEIRTVNAKWDEILNLLRMDNEPAVRVEATEVKGEYR
jgi:hypothetical protein